MFGFLAERPGCWRKRSPPAEEFWPPVYSGYGLQIGAYVIEYSLPTESDVLLDMLCIAGLVANATIIAIQ